MISPENVDISIYTPYRETVMKKGVFIFLAVLTAALMLTSFLSAVNSEIIIAKNAALVVTSQPVIASDATLSELEPETYDSMIDSFYPDRQPAAADSEQLNAIAVSDDTDAEQTMPPVSQTRASEPHANAALINDVEEEKSNATLHADQPDTTIKAETTSERHAPDQVLAEAAADNDEPVIPETPGITDD